MPEAVHQGKLPGEMMETLCCGSASRSETRIPASETDVTNI